MNFFLFKLTFLTYDIKHVYLLTFSSSYFSLGSVAVLVFRAPGTLFSFWIARHGYAVGALPARILQPHYLGGFHCLFSKDVSYICGIYLYSSVLSTSLYASSIFLT